MKNLKIQFYKNQEEKPEKTITIPLSALQVISQLLPKRAKSALEKEGIDLAQCKELAKEKGLVGTLIEIENPTEKMVISVE
jgi:hypothetical protein